MLFVTLTGLRQLWVSLTVLAITFIHWVNQKFTWCSFGEYEVAFFYFCMLIALTINVSEIETAFWITCFKALSQWLSKKQAASLKIKALTETASNRKRVGRRH